MGRGKWRFLLFCYLVVRQPDGFMRVTKAAGMLLDLRVVFVDADRRGDHEGHRGGPQHRDGFVRRRVRGGNEEDHVPQK